MKPETMVKVLRQCAESSNFRWIVEPKYLTEAADMIEGIIDEAEMLHKSCEEHIKAREELANIVRSLVDREPCRIDHNGFCQEHFCHPSCPHDRAKKLVTMCEVCNDEGQVQLTDEGGNRMWWPCPACRPAVKCTCGADSDPGACGHHPSCPLAK